MMDTLYGPLMFVLGGATVLVCMALYVLGAKYHPRRDGFTILSDEEGKRLHRRLSS
jgi:hypothetical protein